MSRTRSRWRWTALVGKVLLNIQLDPSAQRAAVQVHRLNQCPVYRSINKAGALDWRRHMKIIVDEAGEIIAKATDDHTLIGGHHRLSVAASLFKRLFWRDTGVLSLISSSSIMEVLFDIQPEPLAERIVVRVASA